LHQPERRVPDETDRQRLVDGLALTVGRFGWELCLGA
jgi:hypothetical protein